MSQRSHEISTKTTEGLAFAKVNQLGMSNFFKYFLNSPVRCINHLSQMLSSGRFAKYKFFQQIENTTKYGTLEPPEYDVSRIQGIHIRLICGAEDKIATVSQSKEIYEKLRVNNKIELYEFEYGHLGLLFPKEERQMDKIVGIITK